MIVIADSGSTKTDWVILNPSGKVLHQTTTIGFNPVFHSSEFVLEHLNRNDDLYKIQKDVEQVFFYGAGCSSFSKKSIIKNALKKYFEHSNLYIGHDLEAAAIATYNNKPHIACILGTGSNSCYYDGIDCIEKTPALGFVLGDEAGGAYFGKELVKTFLYQQLPKDVHADFIKTYQLNLDQIIDKVYRQPSPNVFLASLAPFIHKHRKYPVLQNIIATGINLFLTHHVLCYPEVKKVQTNFVGSIAYYFQDILHHEAGKLQITVGQIIQKPIDGLVKYHQRKLP